jgi:hypothetical protein
MSFSMRDAVFPRSLQVATGHSTGDRIQQDALLFAWRDDRIVLLVERASIGEGWSVARGWRSADRLTDVRRWHYAASGPMAGQVRRLVDEASSDPSLARRVSTAVSAWVAGDQTTASVEHR